ncbi:hypothetical protein M422DRAFT_150632 [Sphaerobolus stellatus SS14]|nr:hypothetical protein M422DRAFT_150632 [Sphaerobolus stellatus SS14]
MSLEAGTYIIRNGNNSVGRSLLEDLSLFPKPVVLLPPSVTAEDTKINKTDSNGYVIKFRGAPSASIDHRVVALLSEGEEAGQWRIKAVPQHGPNRYIITTQDQDDGWVAPNDPYEQLMCKPLIASLSLPPRYLPNSVFEIVRI